MAPQDFAVGQSSAPIDIIAGFARPSVSFEQGFCAFESDFGICNGGIAFGDGRFGLRNLLRAISILHLAEVGFEQVALRPELSDGVLEIHFFQTGERLALGNAAPFVDMQSFYASGDLEAEIDLSNLDIAL